MKGIIYKICVGEELYIGSTIDKINNRKAKHKYKMKKYPDRSLYKKLIETNTKLELIEIYECEVETIKDLHIIEEEYRIKYNATLNILKCRQTEEDKNNYIINYRKKYREEHKEELNKKARDNYKNNKERINEKSRKNYIKNKKTLLDKINCEYCNCETSKKHLSRHQKSIKCKKFQALIE